MINKTVKVDKNTLQVERGKYVRIYAEVDLTKPVLEIFSIKGRIYKIEYEVLHLLCLSCRRLGHYREWCPELRTDRDGNMVEERSGGNDTYIMQRNGYAFNDERNVGSWRVVQKHKN